MAAVNTGDGQMLRAILAAMKNVFRAGIGIILWPFTWFSGGSRRQHSGIDMGAVKAGEHQVASAKKPVGESLSSLLCVQDAKRDAQIAWSCSRARSARRCRRG
jgi:hypothetical protein